MIIMEGLPGNREEVYTTIIQPPIAPRENDPELDVTMTSCVDAPLGEGQVLTSIIQPFSTDIARSSTPAEAHSVNVMTGNDIPGNNVSTAGQMHEKTANSATTILDIRNPSLALFHNQREKVGHDVRAYSDAMLSDEDGAHPAINNPVPLPILPEQIEKGQTTQMMPAKNLNHSTINLQDLD